MFRDGAERFLVFGIGPERFAVALSAVDEVIDAPPVQRIPDSPRQVLGVTAIRGALVTLYDPRPVLNVEGSVNDAALLFERRQEADAEGKGDDVDRRVGLAIDVLYDTILVESTDVRSAPGADASDRVMLGVVRRGSELIAILDADALLDAAMSDGETRGERT